MYRPRLLQDWLTVQAAQRPEATAVALDGRRLGYGELDSLSNRIAWTLKKAGCRRGDRVGLVAPKELLSIAALVGIYKADCVYVPLDPANPPARLAMMLERCAPRCLLVAGPLKGEVHQLLAEQRSQRSTRIGSLDRAGECVAQAVPRDFDLSDMLGCEDRPLRYRNRGDNAAHILFTSGSTGVPKGVIITHDNVRAFIEWAVPYFGMDHRDRVSSHPPLHFDLSMFDIFGALAVGAELHLFPSELNLNPAEMAEWIRASGITHWFSAPAALNYMAGADVVRFRDFPSLKRLLWCGEVLPTTVLRYLMQRLGHAGFYNLYGPTEATIASSCYQVSRCPPSDLDQVPLGAPCAGEVMLVLDQEMRPVGPGGYGEIYLGGAGLSPGYWGDRETTDAAFILAPSADGSQRLYRTGDLARVGRDGEVYFAGRVDAQVKSRGYRIELGEIELALSSIEGIRECAVVPSRSSGFEQTAICCAYVARQGILLTNTGLRKALGAMLPAYMIPSRWHPLASLPRNANGKIDRKALRAMFEAQLREAPPRTDKALRSA